MPRYLGTCSRFKLLIAVTAIPVNRLTKHLIIKDNHRFGKTVYKLTGYELAKKAGAIRYQSGIGSGLAIKYFNLGAASKGTAFIEESMALNRKAGNMPQLYGNLILRGCYYQAEGEWDKSDQCLKEAFNISKSLDDTQSIVAGGLTGTYYFDRGDYVKARGFLEKWHEVAEKGGYKIGRIGKQIEYEYLIRTYIELGEIEKARKLIDSMYKLSLQVKDRELISIADALRGMQFRAEKKWQDSIDHFEKSLRESEERDIRRWAAYWLANRVLVEYARMYLERDQEGDREMTHKLLDEALEIFQKMGDKGDIEKIIAKKKLLTA